MATKNLTEINQAVQVKNLTIQNSFGEAIYGKDRIESIRVAVNRVGEDLYDEGLHGILYLSLEIVSFLPVLPYRS